VERAVLGKSWKRREKRERKREEEREEREKEREERGRGWDAKNGTDTKRFVSPYFRFRLLVSEANSRRSFSALKYNCKHLL